MFLQNCDALCFCYNLKRKKRKEKNKGGCCLSSVQRVLLPAALISLVASGQWEEIELEIVETLYYVIFWHLCGFSVIPSVFSDVSTENKALLLWRRLKTLTSNKINSPPCFTFIKSLFLCPCYLTSLCADEVIRTMDRIMLNCSQRQTNLEIRIKKKMRGGSLVQK